MTLFRLVLTLSFYNTNNLQYIGLLITIRYVCCDMYLCLPFSIIKLDIFILTIKSWCYFAFNINFQIISSKAMLLHVFFIFISILYKRVTNYVINKLLNEKHIIESLHNNNNTKNYPRKRKLAATGHSDLAVS